MAKLALTQNFRNEFKDYFYITLGLMLYTFGWTVFLLPYEMVTGGVTGVAAIIFYATGIPIFISYFVINAVLLLLALRLLGLKWRADSSTGTRARLHVAYHWLRHDRLLPGHCLLAQRQYRRH